MTRTKTLRPVENGIVEAELQQTAYQLYMRMPDLSLLQVAKKLQLNPDHVRLWAERGEWEHTRTRLQRLHKDRLEMVQEQMQKIGARDAYEHIHSSWKVLRRVLARLDQDMVGHANVNTLKDITVCVKNALDIEKACRDRLGIADVPMN